MHYNGLDGVCWKVGIFRKKSECVFDLADKC